MVCRLETARCHEWGWGRVFFSTPTGLLYFFRFGERKEIVVFVFVFDFDFGEM